MRRREFIARLGCFCGAAAASMFARRASGAQTPAKPLIAWLGAPPPGMSAPPQFVVDSTFNSFVQGLSDIGYVQGRDVRIIRRSEVFAERIPTIEEMIAHLRPDLVAAPATLEAVAAQKATSTIPIVCPALADAVHLGLIASEAHPGGNITGIEPYIGGLPAKQIELAREIVPAAQRIGLLTNLKDPKGPPQMGDLNAACQKLNLKVVQADVSRPDDIADALATLANEKVDVVVVLQTNLLLFSGEQIARIALAKRLPTVFGYREHIITGGLVSYGVDLRWCFHRAAYLVDKILKGARPGDLPIEFPAEFWLAANLKTAKTLGVTLPPTLLARADEVIE